MFGIGTTELLLILVVALIVFGPKKLPDLAKSLGKAMGEFKRATSDLKQSFEQETDLDEERDRLKGVKQNILKPLASPEKAEAAPLQDQADPIPASSPKDMEEEEEDPPRQDQGKTTV